MAASLFTNPSRALDANADPYAGALAYFYATGGTTPQSVYTTSGLSVAHAHPVVADAAGKFPNIYMNSALVYRVVIKNSAGSVTLHDIDPVNDTAVAGLSATVAALAGSGGSASVGFLQSGTGALARTAQDKLRETISLEDFGVGADWDAEQREAQAAALTSGAPVNYLATDYGEARIEAHGRNSFNGNGAGVEYAATGVTLIGGIGAGTAAEVYYFPINIAEDVHAQTPAQIFTLTNIASAGATTITITGGDTNPYNSNEVSDPANITAGDQIWLIGPPSSHSTPTNYVPQYMEVIDVAEINVVGLVGTVTPKSPVRFTYTGTQAAVWTSGTPRNVTIDGFRITTETDAYQYVVRSSDHCVIENIIGDGLSAMGADTFSRNLVKRHWTITGANSAISSARGCISVRHEDIEWRASGSGQAIALFIEESFEQHVIDNFRAFGGAFWIASVDMTDSQAEPRVFVSRSSFDTTGTAVSPMTCGNMLGVDLTVDSTTLKGPSTSPEGYGGGTIFPGFTIAVTSITNVGTTATVTTTAPHGLVTGRLVTVTGATPAAYNVASVAITVTGASTFTYTMLSNPGGNATVVGTLSKHALTWISGLLAGDEVVIRDTTFICTNGTVEPAFEGGSGCAGTVLIDVDSCKFVNCAKPSPLYCLVRRVNATLDFASVPATSTGTALTVAVTGAAVGDPVRVQPPAAALAAGLHIPGAVTAPSVVTVYVNNITSAGAVDAASGVYGIEVGRAA